MKMISKINRKTLTPAIIIVAVFLLLYFLGSQIPEQTIRETIKSAGVFGPLVLILLIWSTNVIAPLSASPFFFAGFYLFGQTVVIYAFVATFIASISNFWLARIWGRTIVEKLAGKESLEKVDKLTQNYGYLTLFIIRVFLSQFYDVISYVFGLTPMKFMPYLIISTVGTIPGTILWYFLTSKINNPVIFTLVTLAMSYFFLMIYLLWIKFSKKEKLFAKRNKVGKNTEQS